jgi:hypothetical protein
MLNSEANENVAERFTRVMNATPSALGPYSDFLVAVGISGAVVTVGFFAIRHATTESALYAVLALAIVPPVVSLVLSQRLRGSRDVVVQWLSSLPFPVENVNALLVGFGDTVEVVFEPGVALPSRSAIAPQLEEVADEVLLTAERVEEQTLEIRLGVIDSKFFPFSTNHERWRRLVAVVEKVLVPLSHGASIRRVYVV